MSTTTIRDDRGRVVAHMREEGDSIRLWDATGHTLGYYRRTRNLTTTALHKPVGPGNQLLRLVPTR